MLKTRLCLLFFGWSLCPETIAYHYTLHVNHLPHLVVAHSTSLAQQSFPGELQIQLILKFEMTMLVSKKIYIDLKL